MFDDEAFDKDELLYEMFGVDNADDLDDAIFSWNPFWKN